jgi:hypothetical protein
VLLDYQHDWLLGDVRWVQRDGLVDWVHRVTVSLPGRGLSVSVN